MAKNTKNTQPPVSSQPSANGGASEHARLDWVLKSQSDLVGRISAIEAHAEHSEKMLLRIEKLIEKASDNQNVEIGKANAEIIKINKKLAYAIGALISGCVVIGFIVNGQLGKISSFMEKQEIHIVQPVTTKKTN
ncbi:MAG: hypothetical protein COA59_06065 [Colwellia sp.]|jgi:hypothetical protein|nr:MAG: hypothetical protein COA59_06065 [Colwellia sp.]